MPNRILQFLRGAASSKPALQDGQGYLEKDTNTFVIQNGSNEIRLSDQTSNITAVQNGLNSTNQTVSTLSSNVATLNSEVDSLQEQVDGIESKRVATATMTTTWSASGSQYVQNVTISGITSNDYPQIIPQWGSNKSAQQTAWNLLTDVQSFNGYITLYASARPSTAVNFAVIF